MTRPQHESGAGRARQAAGQVVVGSYETYAEAERAVDHLSDNRFPVERAAIVGRGLNSVEQVAGRLTTWGAAARSAVSGAVPGALFGWLFGLFDWVDPLIAGCCRRCTARSSARSWAACSDCSGTPRPAAGVTPPRPRGCADSYDVLVADGAAQLPEAAGAPGRGRSAGI
ncbi:general stress protein [Saccharothrix yanglingensis]|uniref:general stress protein n=1 Tax=Saccharothrix yanglingensis TaxID=659496 RepID=UPI0027D29BC1|nr:general stress protein [Saccharothrix yanglingensis]